MSDWASQNLSYDEVMALIDAQLSDDDEKEKIIIAGGDDGEPILASQLCLQWFPFLCRYHRRDEYVPNHPSIVRITQ